jgi:hypothetical protein
MTSLETSFASLVYSEGLADLLLENREFSDIFYALVLDMMLSQLPDRRPVEEQPG